MKKALLSAFLILLGGVLYAQDISVKGTVTSASDGIPLPGVTISVKDVSGKGTTTDADGKYSITVSSNQTLVF